jgi:hypothetical protein
VGGHGGVIGSRVRILDAEGRLLAAQHLSGGDGRGGQAAPVARFALVPGSYRVEVQYRSGLRRGRPLEVARRLVHGVIDDSTPRAE